MRNRNGRCMSCCFSFFKCNIWVEEFWARALVSAYVYKWQLEVNITLLWFDLYVALGRIK